MKTHIACLAVTCVALMTACKVTVTDSDTPASLISEVEGVERARFKAWVAADAAAVGPMLAEDLVYCHSTGVCQNKAELIDFVSSGKQRYVAMDVVSMEAREVDGAVVVNGKLNVGVETAGKPDAFQVVYTDVYSKRNGKWVLVSWQSTRLP
jgi:hypothetical protein